MSPAKTLAERVKAVAPHYANCTTVNEVQKVYKKTYELRGAIRDGLENEDIAVAVLARMAKIELKNLYWDAYLRVERKRVA